MATASAAPPSADMATPDTASPRSLLYVKSSSQYRRSSSRRLLRRIDKEHSQRSLRHLNKSTSRDEEDSKELSSSENVRQSRRSSLSSVTSAATSNTTTSKNQRFSLSARVSLNNLDEDEDRKDKDSDALEKSSEPKKSTRKLRSRPKLQKHNSNDSSASATSSKHHQQAPPRQTKEEPYQTNGVQPKSKSTISPNVQALQRTYQKQLRDSQETLEFHWERAQARLARHNPTGAQAALKHVHAQRQRQEGLVAALEFLLSYQQTQQSPSSSPSSPADVGAEEDSIMQLQQMADQIMSKQQASVKTIMIPEEQGALDAQLMQELQDSLRNTSQ